MTIDRFFKSAPSNHQSSSSSSNKPAKIDLNDLPWDPSERKVISSYHPSQKYETRRAYLFKGPCQPLLPLKDYPQTLYTNKFRRFNPDWYKQKHGNWLEYSVTTDKVYCLYCYLFREIGQNDAFGCEGVQCWNTVNRFDVHVGGCNSFHNNACKKGEDLLKQAQSINVAFDRQTEKQKKEYRIRLGTSVKLTRGLLNGGLPFRGHDESEKSIYRGHFIEFFFLKLMGEINKEIGKVILNNAPGNSQMTALSIQKEIFNCVCRGCIKKNI